MLLRIASSIPLVLLVSLSACSSSVSVNQAVGGGGNGSAGAAAGGSNGGAGGGTGASAAMGGANGGANAGGDQGGSGGLLETGGGPGAGGANGGAGGANGGAGGGAGGANGGAGGSEKEYRVYASTDTTLFQLDPTSPNLPLTKIGDFDCIDEVNGPLTSIVDIAVDKDQKLWGITAHYVLPLTIEGSTVHCGKEIALNTGSPGQQIPTFYALTFAPIGVLHPVKEVLVAGNSAGELWTIDDKGKVAKHGYFGNVPADDGNGHAYDPANVGKPWELSGDIVFLANGNKPVGFATVRDCPNPPSSVGCSKVDTLIEIDMLKFKASNPGAVVKAVRGKVLKGMDCGDAFVEAYGSMFGIAAWNETVFGFSRSGNLVTMGEKDGGTCLVKIYDGDQFSGAGVTTLAPVIEPPVK